MLAAHSAIALGSLDRIFPGADRVMDTLLDPLDNYFETLKDCVHGVDAYYSREDPTMTDLKRAVIAHEAAHCLNVFHSDFFMSNACGTLMYQHADIDPVPTDFDAAMDFPQIRLHLKH